MLTLRYRFTASEPLRARTFPTPRQLGSLWLTMYLFRLLFFVAMGPILAFVNDSSLSFAPHAFAERPHVPATGVGDEYDNQFFPATMLDDKSWDDLLCKGNNLVKAMHASDQDAGKLFQPPSDSARSRWTNLGMLLCMIKLLWL